jgi:hypothetical protein
MNLIKAPTPKNFNTKKVCVYLNEIEDLKAGNYTNLVILKHKTDKVLKTVPITQTMILSLRDMGSYYLMSY